MKVLESEFWNNLATTKAQIINSNQFFFNIYGDISSDVMATNAWSYACMHKEAVSYEHAYLTG